MQTIGISLGNVCYSAQWGVENKLRKTKEEGYYTCPFDLMVSNYKGVIDCIYNDFADFYNPEYLLLSSEGIFNLKYNFGFNHESPEHAGLYLHENWPEGKMHFVNNNYAHFIERYKQRIQSFYNYLSDPNNFIIFIIQFVYDQKPDNDFAELRHALSVKFPNLKYTIISI